MKGKLIGATLLLTSPNVAAQQECPDFSIEQLHTMQEVFDYGKQHNLEYTLTAISWVESRAGEVVININNDGSLDVGAFQINMKTVSKMVDASGRYEKNILASRLVTDIRYSVEMAKEVFIWWYNYHNEDWGKAVMSYNTGFNYKNGSVYKDKIVDSIQMLKRCVNLKTI